MRLVAFWGIVLIWLYLDPHEGSGLEALTRSVARLWAAGVSMDLTQFLSRIAGLRSGGKLLWNRRARF